MPNLAAISEQVQDPCQYRISLMKISERILLSATDLASQEYKGMHMWRSKSGKETCSD
jgi:hypothetical protein